MTLSLNFASDEMFEKAFSILNAKNADSFLRNISMTVENEKEAVEIQFQLEMQGIGFSYNLY